MLLRLFLLLPLPSQYLDYLPTTTCNLTTSIVAWWLMYNVDSCPSHHQWHEPQQAECFCPVILPPILPSLFSYTVQVSIPPHAIPLIDWDTFPDSIYDWCGQVVNLRSGQSLDGTLSCHCASISSFNIMMKCMRPCTKLNPPCLHLCLVQCTGNRALLLPWHGQGLSGCQCGLSYVQRCQRRHPHRERNVRYSSVLRRWFIGEYQSQRASTAIIAFLSRSVHQPLTLYVHRVARLVPSSIYCDRILRPSKWCLNEQPHLAPLRNKCSLFDWSTHFARDK